MDRFTFDSILSFDGYTEDENGYYVSSATFNGLLYINKKDFRIKYLDCFNAEYVYKNTLHHKQYQFGDQIFFMPDHAKRIHIYDIDKKSIRSVPFTNIKGCEVPVRGVDSFRIENCIWIFFAYPQNPIMKFNMETCAIEETHYLYSKLPSEIAQRQIPVFLTPFSNRGHKIYGAVWKSRYIFEFDFITREINFIDLNKNIEMSGLAMLDSGKFLYTKYMDTSVETYDLATAQTEIYLLKDTEIIEKREITYCNIIQAGNKVLLIPNTSEYIFKLDKGEISPYLKVPTEFKRNTDKRSGWRSFYSWEEDQGNIILFPYGFEAQIVINIGKEILNGTIFDITDEEREDISGKLYKEYLNRKFSKLIKERETTDLKEYLEYIDIGGSREWKTWG